MTDILDSLEPKLSKLLYPSSSHMDFNIGCALHLSALASNITQLDEHLWFNSAIFKDCKEKILKLIELKQSESLSELKQQTKQAKSNDYNMVTAEIKSIPPACYVSPTEHYITVASKVVFSGLGADEVFGGYARYRTAFERGGAPEMEKEMSLDLDRLWHRNMGRDDRVISACGKEARFPFLDIDLMRYLAHNCPTEMLCDWSDFRGKGDKKLLRMVAEQRFGLKISSGFEKRAIQFGTRIAKQTNKIKFGSNRKANGKAQFKKF